ncbi:MAG: hypothetical protein P4M15_08625 [Alphaproteobacteria bacterium]|nr:hypothetical protein [Alphaproteobacteria bacterium]
MLSSLAWLSSMFTPAAMPEATNDVSRPVGSAPPEATNDEGDSPSFGWNDPLGAARAANYQVEPVHADSAGYLPSWKFHAPPGIGDAPQHVWATLALFPLCVDGPGDRPASYFRWKVPPIMANFAMRYQGMAVDGGNLLMTGLYVPDPLQQLSNDVYAGS